MRIVPLLGPAGTFYPGVNMPRCASNAIVHSGIDMAAGFVDFTRGKGKGFYPALLRSLLPSHVVQVAHHAGL